MPRPAYDHVQEALLEACSDLFLSVGIRDTEMQQIATRAGISRSTLYRYITDKAQLVFMVATDLMFRTTNRCLACAMDPEQNGYEKLKRFSHVLAREVNNNPGFIRFLSELELLYGKGPLDTPEARMYTEGMVKLIHREAQFLFEGMADGSIRSMEDPMGFISMLIHTVYGLSKCTIMGGLFTGAAYAVATIDDIDRTLDILMESVQAG